MPASEGEDVLGTFAVAKILGMSRDRVSALCRKGAFPQARQDGQGRPWHIPKEDVENYARGKHHQISRMERKV